MSRVSMSSSTTNTVQVVTGDESPRTQPHNGCHGAQARSNSTRAGPGVHLCIRAVVGGPALTTPVSQWAKYISRRNCAKPDAVNPVGPAFGLCSGWFVAGPCFPLRSTLVDFRRLRSSLRRMRERDHQVSGEAAMKNWVKRLNGARPSARGVGRWGLVLALAACSAPAGLQKVSRPAPPDGTDGAAAFERLKGLGGHVGDPRPGGQARRPRGSSSSPTALC